MIGSPEAAVSAHDRHGLNGSDRSEGASRRRGRGKSSANGDDGDRDRLLLTVGVFTRLDEVGGPDLQAYCDYVIPSMNDQ
jgi:hypothetical protein